MMRGAGPVTITNANNAILSSVAKTTDHASPIATRSARSLVSLTIDVFALTTGVRGPTPPPTG